MTLEPGDIVGNRWEVLTGPIAYQGKEGCRDPRCTRHRDVEDRCFGYHCPHCEGSTSMYGHYVSGRWIDGKLRKFKDGGGALSCQLGFEDIPIEDAEAA